MAKEHGWEYRNGMVKLSSDLTFDPGSDTVVEDAAAGLRQFAQIMNEPDAAKYNVYIAGHTDDIPISKQETKRKHPTNWYLSAHRAISVAHALISQGIGQNRLGSGSYLLQYRGHNSFVILQHGGQ